MMNTAAIHGAPRSALRRSRSLKFSLICLFLPVDFIYQSIVAFLVAAILLDLVPAYFFRELEPRRIREAAIVISVCLVVVLASAKWGL